MLIALLFSLLLHTLTSCRKSLIGNGPLETRTTETEAFRAIALSADFVVHVRTAPVPRLIIRAQENVHPWISAENDKGILKLGYRTGIRVLKHEPVEITVEGPACGEYTVSGSGQIGLEDELKVPALQATVSGSGSINLPAFRGSSVSATISGSGRIQINGGQSDWLGTKVSGSGHMALGGLEARDVHTQTSGSGDTDVWATASLVAHISGSGCVYYRGNPVIESHISGSGRLIKR